MAMQLKITVETGFFANVYADPHAKNRGNTAGVISSAYALGVTGTPIQITKVNVLDYLIDAGSVLDEQNVPETGRWFVIPTWMAGMTGDGTSPLRNGRIGQIDRFTLYSSNLLKHAVSGGKDEFYAMFGTNDGITFASQLVKTETIRAQNAFADLVRGLKIFDYKTIKPEAIGVLCCYK